MVFSAWLYYQLDVQFSSFSVSGIAFPSFLFNFWKLHAITQFQCLYFKTEYIERSIHVPFYFFSFFFIPSKILTMNTVLPFAFSLNNKQNNMYMIWRSLSIVVCGGCPYVFCNCTVLIQEVFFTCGLTDFLKFTQQRALNSHRRKIVPYQFSTLIIKFII